MRRWPVLLAALLFLLSGCAPQARELDGMALVRVLGVDGGEEVTLTARVRRHGSGGCEPGGGIRRRFSVRPAGPALGGGGGAGDDQHSYIIVGAEADLSEALGLILSDHEMSPSATVWLTQDAGALLDACEDPAARLAVLEEQGVEAPTVVMVLAALKTDWQVELPVLSLADGQLEPAGQAVWEEKV